MRSLSSYFSLKDTLKSQSVAESSQSESQSHCLTPRLHGSEKSSYQIRNVPCYLLFL